MIGKLNFSTVFNIPFLYLALIFALTIFNTMADFYFYQKMYFSNDRTLEGPDVIYFSGKNYNYQYRQSFTH